MNGWKRRDRLPYRSISFYFVSLINSSTCSSIAVLKRKSTSYHFFLVSVPSTLSSFFLFYFLASSSEWECGVKFVNTQLITFASFSICRVLSQDFPENFPRSRRKVFCLRSCSKLKCRRGRWNLSLRPADFIGRITFRHFHGETTSLVFFLSLIRKFNCFIDQKILLLVCFNWNLLLHDSFDWCIE